MPLMALWANLHGGWIVGIGTLGLYTTSAILLDLIAGEGWRRGLRYAAITLCSLIATLLNPYGVDLWHAVAWALTEPYKRLVNIEWQPMLFAMAQQWHQAHSGIFVYVAVIVLIVGLATAYAFAPRGRL
jgi:hypothetical protein